MRRIKRNVGAVHSSDIFPPSLQNAELQFSAQWCFWLRDGSLTFVPGWLFVSEHFEAKPATQGRGSALSAHPTT